MKIISKFLNFMPTRNRIKTVSQDESDFRINNGFLVYGRAELTIVDDCPAKYKEMIQYAYKKGWIKLAANMYDYEYTMDKLKESQ